MFNSFLSVLCTLFLVQYAVCEGGCRFTATHVDEGRGNKALKKLAEKKREVEEADKAEVTVALGVTVETLRRFRAAARCLDLCVVITYIEQ